MASARLGNLDLGVLRGHNARERGQNDPSPQQPPVIVVDKETRRTLLHYFKFQPSDEESAERGDIECGAPDSKTGGWFPAERLRRLLHRRYVENVTQRTNQ